MRTQVIIKHEFSSPRAGWSDGNNGKVAPRASTDRRETSDKALIKSIGKGDKRAIEVLFARHNARIFRFALSLIRDESMAEDLVSEVFFDAWRQAGKFEGRSQVSTWLLGICRNKAIATLRRSSEAQLDDAMAETIEDQADDQAV